MRSIVFVFPIVSQYNWHIVFSVDHLKGGKEFREIEFREIEFREIEFHVYTILDETKKLVKNTGIIQFHEFFALYCFFSGSPLIILAICLALILKNVVT